jgi:hypothetical protein
MAPTLNLWRGLVLLSLFVSTFQGVTPPPSTCKPQPDYWFLEVFHLGEVDLPAGVSVSTSPRGSARGYLKINNAADSPLYVLPNSARQSIIETAEPQIGDEDLLEGEYEVEQFVLLERVPELAVYTVDDTQESGLRLDIQKLGVLESGLVDRNVLESSRPSFVILPPAQRLKLLLVFDGTLYEIPYTLSYQLNEGYAPKVCPQMDVAIKQTESPGFDATPESPLSPILNSSTLVFAIMLVAALVIAVWIVRKN